MTVEYVIGAATVEYVNGAAATVGYVNGAATVE